MSFFSSIRIQRPAIKVTQKTRKINRKTKRKMIKRKKKGKIKQRRTKQNCDSTMQGYKKVVGIIK